VGKIRFATGIPNSTAANVAIFSPAFSITSAIYYYHQPLSTEYFLETAL